MSLQSTAIRRQATRRDQVNTVILLQLWTVASAQVAFAKGPFAKYFSDWWSIPAGIWLLLLYVLLLINIRPRGTFLITCLLHIIVSVILLALAYWLLPALFEADQLCAFGPILITFSVLLSIGILHVLDIPEDEIRQILRRVNIFLIFGLTTWSASQEIGSIINPGNAEATSGQGQGQDDGSV